MPSSAVPVVHSLLTVLNIHPVHIRQVILNDLSSCQYHTRVTTTLEALSAKMVKQMNEAMSLKAHYISYILRGVILEGQTLLEKYVYGKIKNIHFCIYTVDLANIIEFFLLLVVIYTYNIVIWEFLCAEIFI